MSAQRQWALLAAVVFLAVVYVHSLPVADDKADEMSIVAAMNVEEEIKPSTEDPNEEPPKPKDLDTNHIQVIKMPSAEEAAEIIEELEEEIEREKEVIEHMKEEELKEINEHETNTEINKEVPMLPPMDAVKAEETPKNDMQKPMVERSPRNMLMDEPNQKEKVPQESSLTDDDIDKIMKMIAFPQTDEVEKPANDELKTDTETKVEIEVEPRTTDAESTEAKTRIGRAIRSEGKGYYILAFTPVEGPLVPSYTKFDIIPIERSVNGDSNIDDYDEHDQNQPQLADSDLEEGRLLSRKQFNHYIRKMMRQIRKGTRKIQRKTRLRSAVEDEPTVENFVRKWYETNQKGKAALPKRSWFSWPQKAQ